jgi:hypothetical protein
MTDVVIEGDATRRGGYALIRISGGAGKGLADPRFRLSRDGYEAGTLGEGGWQVADAMLTPLAARAESTDLVLSVGPAVVDLIESGVVTLGIPAVGFDEPVFWPEMPLSRGGQGSASMVLPIAANAATPILVTQPPIEVQAKADTPSPPVPPPVAPAFPLTGSDSPPRDGPATVSPKRHWPLLLPLGLGCVLLAVAMGGSAWWALHGRETAATLVPMPSPTHAPMPPSASAHTPPPTPGPTYAPAAVIAPPQASAPAQANLGSESVRAPVQVGPPTPGDAFAQGLADRHSYEAWIADLNEDARQGALFWAGNRSRLSRGERVSCADPNDQWSVGCKQAQARLDAPDKRRLSEPDYRAGWNSF